MFFVSTIAASVGLVAVELKSSRRAASQFVTVVMGALGMQAPPQPFHGSETSAGDSSGAAASTYMTDSDFIFVVTFFLVETMNNQKHFFFKQEGVTPLCRPREKNPLRTQPPQG